MKLTVTLLYKSIFFSGYSGYDNSLRKHKFIHFNSVQIHYLFEKEFPSNHAEERVTDQRRPLWLSWHNSGCRYRTLPFCLRCSPGVVLAQTTESFLCWLPAVSPCCRSASATLPSTDTFRSATGDAAKLCEGEMAAGSEMRLMLGVCQVSERGGCYYCSVSKPSAEYSQK